MSPYVIKAEGYANVLLDCPFAGQYLEWFDPDILDDTQDMATFVVDPAEAKLFASALEALEEWKRIRTRDPWRVDGKPNRPLTALTVSIEPWPNGEKS